MSEQPKDGLYLDRMLAVIGEQVEERIDEQTRRRRMRNRFGVAVLALVTVMAGSTAAYAISTSSHVPTRSVSPVATVVTEVRCTSSSAPAAPAYFTATYRVLQGVKIDQTAVCATVRTAIASDPGRYADVSPEEAIAAAADIIEGSGGRDVTVLRASFGALPTAPSPGTQ